MSTTVAIAEVLERLKAEARREAFFEAAYQLSKLGPTEDCRQIK